MYLFEDRDFFRKQAAEHPYYRALYGRSRTSQIGIAASLSALFENIALVGADTKIPGLPTTVSEPQRNDFGVSLHWKYGDGNEESALVAKALATNQSVIGALHSHGTAFQDGWDAQFFLRRLVAQILLARETNAVLLGNAFFKRMHDMVLPTVVRELDAGGASANQAWSVAAKDIDILCLDHGIRTLEDFEAVRASKEVARYAKHVRQVIGSAAETGNVKKALLEAAEHAMHSEEIAERALTAARTAGTVSTIAGAVPVLGLIATSISLATDAAGRAIEATDSSRSWIHIGAKMTQARVDERIRKGIQKRREAG